MTAERYRLPTNVKPNSYNLIVKTDLEKLEFEGSVEISLDVLHDTTSISLHSSDLQLGAAFLYIEDIQSEKRLEKEVTETASERITYDIQNCISAGSKAKLRIAFSGKLLGNMAGYYQSSYMIEGKKNFYSLTQLAPTAARRAFPCWDEPLLKATFAVTLISREETVNLSNMPASSEIMCTKSTAITDGDAGMLELLSTLKNPSKWKITRFLDTPPMSSYLVAYANGHFEYLESFAVMPLSGRTVPLRIYATADNIRQGQFSLDVKAKVLPLYEKIFDVQFPLPKLDTLVASDFDLGAMENWGLITGRTNAFLLDNEKADFQAKKKVAGTTSHEVAHMWFGNITTMTWWNYIYLNEGFATLMGEVIIADKVFPEWKVDSEFISHHLNRALNLDSKPSSHPIEVDLPDANHIYQIFDALSYSKAASVLRMLSYYVGQENFLKGVSIYLKNHLYGNSTSRDLWDGIRQATNIDIAKLMNNWVSKIGFPVITVTENENGIQVRQDRFLKSGRAPDEENETLWSIPLNIISIGKDGDIIQHNGAVLDKREMNYELNVNQPFKLNAGTSGVYRVLYTPERLTAIATEASRPENQKLFSLNDRIGLLYDAMALSESGLAKLSSALTLVDLWRNETEYLVWSGIAENLGNLVSVWWEHKRTVEQLNAFRRELFLPLVRRLGYDYSEKDSMDTSLLRTCAITQAAAAEVEEVIKELQRRFAHFIDTGDISMIPADLQQVIFVTAVKHGGKAEYEAVLGLYDTPKTPTTHIAIIVAMGATQNNALLEETLNFITTKARDQDFSYFFRGLGENFNARRRLSQFFQREYNDLYLRFKESFMLTNLVKLALDYFSSEYDHEQVCEYFKDKDTSKYDLSLAQVLDGIKARTEYIKRSSDDLAGWFDRKK